MGIQRFHEKNKWISCVSTGVFLSNKKLLKVTSATKRSLFKICHLKHRLRFFLFRRKIIFRSQDIQVSVFLTIPWFTKSLTSWWVLVHETECIFKYIFWTTTHWVTKLGQLIDIRKVSNFHKSSEEFQGLGLTSRFFLI